MAHPFIALVAVVICNPPSILWPPEYFSGPFYFNALQHSFFQYRCVEKNRAPECRGADNKQLMLGEYISNAKQAAAFLKKSGAKNFFYAREISTACPNLFQPSWHSSIWSISLCSDRFGALAHFTSNSHTGRKPRLSSCISLSLSV